MPKEKIPKDGTLNFCDDCLLGGECLGEDFLRGASLGNRDAAIEVRLTRQQAQFYIDSMVARKRCPRQKGMEQIANEGNFPDIDRKIG